MLKKILNLFRKPRPWADIEYFDDSWKERIKTMAAFIPENSVVADLGCGKMWLKEFLPNNASYIPVDYKKRSDDCLVIDFNKNEFPAVDVDVAFISGCLEYITAPELFLDKVCNFSRLIIISYCTTDLFPSSAERKSNHWVNSLSEKELIQKIESMGFKNAHIIKAVNTSPIFVFHHE